MAAGSEVKSLGNEYYPLMVFGVSFLGFATFLLAIFVSMKALKEARRSGSTFERKLKGQAILGEDGKDVYEVKSPVTRMFRRQEDDVEAKAMVQPLPQEDGAEEGLECRRTYNMNYGKKWSEKGKESYRLFMPSVSIMSRNRPISTNLTEHRVTQPIEDRSRSLSRPAFVASSNFSLPMTPPPAVRQSDDNDDGVAKNNVNLGHIPSWFNCRFNVLGDPRSSIYITGSKEEDTKRNSQLPFIEASPIMQPCRISHLAPNRRRSTLAELKRRDSYIRLSRSIIDGK